MSARRTFLLVGSLLCGAAVIGADPLPIPPLMLKPVLYGHLPFWDVKATSGSQVGGGGGGGGVANSGDLVLGVASQGIIVRTGANTYTVRLLASDVGIAMSNIDGVSGNPTIGVDTAVIPMFATGASDPSAACTAGSTFFLQTTTHLPWYCTATDTWSKLLSGNAPTIGKASVATGTLGFVGTTSGTVTVKSADAAGTWTLTLPTSGGTNNYVLTTNGSGTTSWAAASGGGGWSVSAKTFSDTPITVGATNVAYSCNATGGAVIFNLPACSTNGNLIVILKKTDSSANKCELARNGSDTIDGGTVWDVITQYGSVMVQCDGTSSWLVE